MIQTLTLLRNVVFQIPAHIMIVRSQLKLPSFLNEVLIGIILADGHLYRSSPTANTRLEMSIGSMYKPLANYIFGLFVYYLNTPIPHQR